MVIYGFGWIKTNWSICSLETFRCQLECKLTSFHIYCVFIYNKWAVGADMPPSGQPRVQHGWLVNHIPEQLRSTNIPQATIHNLINSMRRQCAALFYSEASSGQPQILAGFLAPSVQWPFILGSLRQYSCCLIVILICHIPAVDDPSKAEVLTTIFTKYERNWPFVPIQKYS